ncbi:hypothetical protein HG536_0E04750 [Torulaspora globosa]|uniref:SUN domain-containing protein n=1 Tax=Torulaspora globosa TaxID=48254 RepID=A0A7G3ZJ78_9SACH|nr:uncharacterized protein HG536_0E04750 [Torulaspora globosa]QLL33564.1 hypothetical protein HG536_0E04750 [Torulaspora globosa]
MTELDGKDRIYNKSMKAAYADLLMEKMASGTGSAVYDNNEGGCEEGELAMIQDDEENDGEDDDGYYGRFKRSILRERGEELEKTSMSELEEEDDGWLDDNSTLDEDYTDEADRSFYADNGEEDSEDYEEESDYQYDGRYADEAPSAGLISRKWSLVALALVIMLIVGPAMNGLLFSGQSSLKPSSGSPAIQKQINHLYSEMTTREQRAKSEFDKTIKVIISQFEKKIKELLPANVMKLQNQLESLTNRVNNLSFSLSQREYGSGPVFSIENVTEWQRRLVQDLETSLPQQIPVVMNNNTSMLVLPELNNYLAQVISSLVQERDTIREEQSLKYDLNCYVKEILANEFQYVDKAFFISELNRRMQLNKHEILQEMNDKLDQYKLESAKNRSPSETIPQQYSNILLKKLVNKIYNTNQHQWEDDLDYATFAQGTKLLNHLTSSTWSLGNGVNPVELLRDSRIGSSTYWQCSGSRSCSWAVRFKEPAYLTRVSYVHGRFNNNLHMMNSAPKVISVYVKLAKSSPNVDVKRLTELARSFKQGQPFNKDGQHVRIGQYHYSLTDNQVRQVLPLPSWFIQLKPLVRSVVFEINENHGNSRFTSLRKFIINAVTQEDLRIMESNSFPFRSDDPPDYALSSIDTTKLKAAKLEQSHEVPQLDDDAAGLSKDRIPSFGQDEPDST